MANEPEQWWLQYLGKPWQAVPQPPDSYNCGELVRAAHREIAGIKSNLIPPLNAASAIECAKAMRPDLYDLAPVGHLPRRDLDVAFMGRRHFLSHCGLAVLCREGLKILHCPQAACGVVLDSPFELSIMGFSLIRWFRHRSLL